MLNIKSFNEQLNRSDEQRFDRWKHYRQRLTETIVRLIEANNSKSSHRIFMLAVGSADDIDLSVIESLAQRLVLTDIDGDALKKAFARYKLSQAISRYQIIDYCGLDQDGRWLAFLKSLKNIDAIETAKKAIDQLFSKLHCSFEHNHLGQYDVVIMMPLFTQLLFMQFQKELALLVMEKTQAIFIESCTRYFLDQMPHVFTEINKALFSLLEEKGIAIIVSDVLEAKPSTSFAKRLHTALSKGQFERVYQDYLGRYGLGLGDFGLENARTFGELLDSSWFEWPFSEDRTMYVRLDLLQKK